MRKSSSVTRVLPSTLLEEAAATVSEVIRAKEAAQIAPIRNVRRYLFRVFLRKVAEARRNETTYEDVGQWYSHPCDDSHGDRLDSRILLARVEGKPRIVHQTCLGTVERIAALLQDRTAPLPLSITTVDLGLPGALWRAAQQSGVWEVLIVTAFCLRSGVSPPSGSPRSNSGMPLMASRPAAMEKKMNWNRRSRDCWRPGKTSN